MHKSKSIMENEPDLESAITALRRLSHQSRELVTPLIRQLAEREGISVASAAAPESKPAVQGIELWVAKLRGERRSERTVEMYCYLVERFLERYPEPAKTDIRQYLARRLEEGISPAAVENERKALRSLFSFLHQEGLICEDPTSGIMHLKVPYNERRCPSVEDVERVLEVGCLRSNDTDKIRLIVRLIATTGLRLTETASLRKENIDLESLELRVVGKGNKMRVVPLLPEIGGVIREYMEKRPGDSPFLFPGKTRTGYA